MAWTSYNSGNQHGGSPRTLSCPVWGQWRSWGPETSEQQQLSDAGEWTQSAGHLTFPPQLLSSVFVYTVIKGFGYKTLNRPVYFLVFLLHIDPNICEVIMFVPIQELFEARLTNLQAWIREEWGKYRNNRSKLITEMPFLTTHALVSKVGDLQLWREVYKLHNKDTTNSAEYLKVTDKRIELKGKTYAVV